MRVGRAVPALSLLPQNSNAREEWWAWPTLQRRLLAGGHDPDFVE